jgi:nucleotide-binding universal stress UspA family protein
VPRFVAAGDVMSIPYLVMEYVEGESLARTLERAPCPPAEVARIGAALADALHSLHQQEVVHLDFKPENVILRPDGLAVLLDFGFAHHARYPDLLAEERHFAAGSAPFVSPEQLRDRRDDPRSDLFSLGVALYALATGEAPFGAPATLAGMRDRLWRQPLPPRARVPDIPAWLQEIILRCLEPEAHARYQSAAHVAFDLRNPDQVAITARGRRIEAPGFASQVRLWWNARARPLDEPESASRPRAARVVLVAVDTTNLDDSRHPSIQWTARQVLSLGGELRMMCVSVIRGAPVGEGETLAETDSGLHLDHLARLRHWVEPLGLPAERLSLHVMQSADPAATILGLARSNHVDLIILGAPPPSQTRLAWWRSVASGVTANAHCSVHVVRTPEPGA